MCVLSQRWCGHDELSTPPKEKLEVIKALLSKLTLPSTFHVLYLLLLLFLLFLLLLLEGSKRRAEAALVMVFQNNKEMVV